MSELHTPRLRLRMFRAEDIDSFAAIQADPEVVRYLHGQPMSRLEAWRHLAMLVGHWQLRGYGMWAVEDRASGHLIGRIGFVDPDGWPGFELGWTIARSHWGQGFATEGARAALNHAFESMGRSKVISLIHPDNRRSIRVAEKLGERFEGTTEVLGHPVLIFGIDRQTWLEQSDRTTPREL